MILIVENWEKGEMELAMLLDESPSPSNDAVNYTLEPWAEGGSLALCLETAETKGKAELYLVFRSDARASWGSRRITAVAGGVLLSDAVPGRGLKFEVVARHLFGNVVGQDSSYPYRVVEEAFLAPDPDRAGGRLLEQDQMHPSLGYRVSHRGGSYSLSNDDGAKDGGNGVGIDVDYGTGVRIKWVDQTGYSEDWFVADEKGGAEFEFLAVEFSRRQYVQVILASLGFVRIASFLPKSREAMTFALLRGIAPHLQALTALLVDNTPTRFAPVLQPGLGKAAVDTAPAAHLQPTPLPVTTKFSSRLSPAMNANSTPAEKSPSFLGFEGANPSSKLHGIASFVQPATANIPDSVPSSSGNIGKASLQESPNGNRLQAQEVSTGAEDSASRGRDGSQAGVAVKTSGLQRSSSNGAAAGQVRSTTPLSRLGHGAGQAASSLPAKRRREETKLEVVELSD